MNALILTIMCYASAQTVESLRFQFVCPSVNEKVCKSNIFGKNNCFCMYISGEM